jgi:hypothetical protein
LVLALYGHPDSGGYWEAHCTKELVAAGFAPVPTWPSCFVHAQLALFLVVYVDDFKLAGPVSNLAAGWKLIRRNIKTDDPARLSKYLGCEHREFSAVLDVRGDPEHAWFQWPPAPGTSDTAASARGGSQTPKTSGERVNVRVREYDMSGFFRSCVDAYLELAGSNAKPLRKVDSPFLAEDLAPTRARRRTPEVNSSRSPPECS